MLMTHIPEMLFSEKAGWVDIDRAHSPSHWFFKNLVLPMSLLPPALYAYAELVHPGEVFARSVPAMTPVQLLVMGLVFYVAQLLMVTYMAMLIQRTALARDHDPGYHGAYALAAIAPVPLWLSSLSLLVPNTGFVVAAVALAWIASAALIRHGVRPLLHISDGKRAHHVANLVTLAGVVAWVGLIVVTEIVLSLVLGWWAV